MTTYYDLTELSPRLRLRIGAFTPTIGDYVYLLDIYG